MSSQNSKTKNLFKSAARNTGKFLGGLFGSGKDVMGPNPHTKSGQSKRSTRQGAITKFMGKFKDDGGYANSREAYQNYLNSLDRLKTGYQRFSGAKVATGMMSPRSAGRIGAVGAATTFEDTLGDWNSRMRKFAVQRYYASLGKK
tara:strand:+ start:353 stop:787 length:435 start_codon:yes stop_codon:yes gene_type:complete